MANDRTTIVIDADASGVSSAVNQAERSLDRLGSSVDDESRRLNRYGERLGRAFGPGEGLHGRLDALEGPLRDSEGAFARAQMAVIEFGNKGATASDKIGAGFLLAGDAIAAFTSGGAVGLAISAAVAGFSILTSAINEQDEASKEAEETAKKQAEALDQLAQSALSAGLSIVAQEALGRMAEESKNVLEVDKQLVQNRKEQIQLLRELDKENDAIAKANEAALLFNEEERINLRVLPAERKQASERLQELRRAEIKLAQDLAKAEGEVTDAAFQASQDRVRFSDSVTSRILGNAKEISGALKEAREEIKKAEKAAHRETEAEVMTRYAAELKAREEQQAALRAEDEAFDARQAERQEQARQRLREQLAANREATLAQIEDAEALARANEEADRKRFEAFEKGHSAEIAAAKATIGALQTMAHEGELSFSKLADAAITAAGNDLVASGTSVLMKGVAKLFNPLTAPIGAAEAKQGGLMIAAGLGMGAAGGFIGRAGAATTPTNAASVSAPTDTRETRSAATAGDSGGGTTIVNINGPAYDRRGVSQVINSGMKMARHRRIAGA